MAERGGGGKVEEVEEVEEEEEEDYVPEHVPEWLEWVHEVDGVWVPKWSGDDDVVTWEDNEDGITDYTDCERDGVLFSGKAKVTDYRGKPDRYLIYKDGAIHADGEPAYYDCEWDSEVLEFFNMGRLHKVDGEARIFRYGRGVGPGHWFINGEYYKTEEEFEDAATKWMMVHGGLGRLTKRARTT